MLQAIMKCNRILSVAGSPHTEDFWLLEFTCALQNLDFKWSHCARVEIFVTSNQKSSVHVLTCTYVAVTGRKRTTVCGLIRLVI